MVTHPEVSRGVAVLACVHLRRPPAMTTKATRKTPRTGGPYPVKVTRLTTPVKASVRSWSYLERGHRDVVVEVRDVKGYHICTAILKVPK